MDPKSYDAPSMLLAPGAGASGALRLPAARELPPVDEHLVQPETSRDELVQGRRVAAMPALPPHADGHFTLDYILGAHVKKGYVGATELLTRSAKASNFATDTCIRREGIDPATGGRYLEELAFEVVHEQSLRDITEKAEDLTARGVRRVVALFVKKGEVCEWKGAWQTLDPAAMFTDPTLARSLRVRALLDAAEADDAVARALLAKNNPVLLKAENDSRNAGIAEGRDAGIQEGIRDLCELLGIPLTGAREAALAAMDRPALDALRIRLKRDRRWE